MKDLLSELFETGITISNIVTWFELEIRKEEEVGLVRICESPTSKRSGASGSAFQGETRRIEVDSSKAEQLRAF